MVRLSVVVKRVDFIPSSIVFVELPWQFGRHKKRKTYTELSSYLED
jgi:hypothetical protein